MANEPIKILLVEDNPGDARLIQEWLIEAMGAGIQLENANRLSIGMERMSSQNPDVVLLDLSLPDSQGLETFTKMHAQNKTVPIVVLSGLDDEDAGLEAVRHGAQDYLVKRNVHAKVLARVIRYSMGRKGLDRLKDEFVSTVSHEIRTPLSIIKEGVNLLIDKIPGPINEKQERVLTATKVNIDRLARIIDNLLDTAALESGKYKLTRELIDIADVIKQVTAAFESKARDKGLELRVNAPKPGVQLLADADKIAQIFTNLIGNAIKFTEQGCIEISAIEKEQEIECAVADTGKGISKEDLTHIFSKFQQFGRKQGPGEKGTGLGLVIAEGVVKLHQGRIWVESELHKGTRFIFTLPKYSPEQYFDMSLKEIIAQSSQASLIFISLTQSMGEGESISSKKLQLLAKEMGEALKKSIGRRGDLVIQIADKLAVLLPDCGKDNILSVEARLQGIINEYLSTQVLVDGLIVKIGCATYPDDATSDADLIECAKKASKSHSR